MSGFEHFISQARGLAQAQISPTQADVFLRDLLFPSQVFETPEQILAAQGNSGYAKIKALFNGAGKGSTLKGNVGTAWGLVNSVTEYIDHHRGNAATIRDTRMDYAWFGDGDKLKSQAFAKALEMVK